MEYTGERLILDKDNNEIEAEHIHRYKAIVSILEGKRVLDAGCGSGYGSSIISKSSKQISAVDISSEAISWCKEKYGHIENLEFVEASLTSLPFDSNSFDIVVNFEVIEHLNEKDQKLFLKEAKRVLADDGILIISTPNKKVYTDKYNYSNPYHIHEFYEDEFDVFLKSEFDYVNTNYQTFVKVSLIEPQNRIETKLINESVANTDSKYLVSICCDNKDIIKKCDISSIYAYENIPFGVVSSVYPIFDHKISEVNKLSNMLEVFENGKFRFEAKCDFHNELNGIRFDPVEDLFCICNIEKVIVNEDEITLEPINAIEYYENGFLFLNTDPQFESKFESKIINNLIIEGYLRILSYNEISFFINKLYTDFMIKLEKSNYENYSMEKLQGLIRAGLGIITEENKIISNNLSAHKTDLNDIRYSINNKYSDIVKKNSDSLDIINDIKYSLDSMDYFFKTMNNSIGDRIDYIEKSIMENGSKISNLDEKIEKSRLLNKIKSLFK